MSTVVEKKDRPITNTSLIQEGDVFSRFSCGKVVRVDFASITLKNTQGLEWSIDKSIVEQEFVFANHAEEFESVTRTEMIELVRNNPRIAMSITFNKKVDPKQVAELLTEGRGDLTTRQWNKKVKEALLGEERTMNGVHHCAFDEHGRLRFIEIAGREGMAGHRLVDLRTINSVTFHNTKYTIK